MGSERDKKDGQPADKAAEKPAPTSGTGRVTVDSRGRNVWQWENENDSTSLLLKQLENDALALEPTRNFRRPDVGAADKPSADRDPGSDRDGRRQADGKASAGRPESGRDVPGRVQHYPDRSGSRPAARDSNRRDIGKPSGSRRGGGFDPYNNG